MKGFLFVIYFLVVFGKYGDCPGKCSGHGTCTPRNVNHAPDLPDYICRCEPDYTGLDCEQRKCITTFPAVNLRRTPDVEEFAIKPKSSKKPIITGCLAYAEYVDEKSRKHYTNVFNIFKNFSSAYVDNNNNNHNHHVVYNECTGDDYPSFEEAINSIQNITTKIKSVEIRRVSTTAIMVRLKYDVKNPLYVDPNVKIKILTNDELKIYPYSHKKNLVEIKTSVIGSKVYNPLISKFIYYEGHKSLSPVECSGNGECDRKTGNCKCFDGYDGLSCNIRL